MDLIDRNQLTVCSIDHMDIPINKGLMCYLAEDVDNVPTIQAIPLDRIKQAREEINSKMESIVGEYKSGTPFEQMPSAKIHRNNARKECIEILDKLIAESSTEMS